MKESQLQIAIATYIRMQYPDVTFFSVPNEQGYTGAKAAIYGHKLNQMGRMPGVADLFITRANKGLHGLFIEVKTPKGKQSEWQKLFQSKITNEGYLYVVVKDFDNGKTTIDNYLK